MSQKCEKQADTPGNQYNINQEGKSSLKWAVQSFADCGD